jgi:hypothetical protein
MSTKKHDPKSLSKEFQNKPFDLDLKSIAGIPDSKCLTWRLKWIVIFRDFSWMLK